jgi:glycosyltransferase involved in cell wall biosynthesis
MRRDAAAQAAPVRLLTLATLFPNASNPRHGIFVANRLRRLVDTGRVQATVIAAIPAFPGAYGRLRGVPPAERIAGFDVRHPRYANVPAAGMRWQPRSLRRAILAELRRAGATGSDFDVIDAHYFYPDGVAAAAVADALGLPLVVSARGSDINVIGDIAFARARMLDAARRASALIAVSGALADRMKDLGMPAARIHVLRNGVDLDVFAPVPRADARRRLGLAEEGPLVLAVGNLVPGKAFDLLVRAMADIADARLLLVGEGPLQIELEALARSLLPGRAALRPSMPQADLRDAYAAADVLAVTSLREGFPNVVIESMACGTPVVASPVGGVVEIVGEGAPGRLVYERSPAAWSSALRATLADPPPRDAVRRHAEAFSWDATIDAQCALYHRVAAERAAG